MIDIRIDDARKLIIDACKTLSAKGLTVGSWGNISFKIEKDAIAITPSGRDYDMMQVDDIVVINTEGKKMMGKRTPSSETKLHLAIYAANPRIKAIVHTHSVYATAVAAMHKSIPAIVEDSAQLCDDGVINVADYSVAGTNILADNAVKALGKGNAVLLANHGVVACGADLKEAVINAELVEKTAQIYCIASSLGGACTINNADIKHLRDFYNNHYSKRREGKEI